MKNRKKDREKLGKPELLQLVFMTALLFVFWLIMSGIFELQMILIGLATSVVVAWITRPLVRIQSPRTPSRTYLIFRLPFFKFILYCFWLFIEIIKASIYVIKLVLNPKMPISPVVVTFKNEFDNPLSIVTLGNSITLTPGTITILIEDNVYHIHAITKQAGLDTALPDGEYTDMAKRIAKLFGENLELKADENK